MLALLSAAFLALAPAPLDDCEACRPGKTCSPHRKHDAAELKRLKPELESKDERTRMGALSAVAELTDEHSNAPTKAVAQALADALYDDRLAVRSHAIRLLADGQHPEVAVTAIAKVYGQFESDMWTLVATLMGEKGERGSVDDAMRYLEDSVRAGRGLRDDRIVKSMSSLLLAYPTEMRGEPVAMATTDALLELGTQGAVSAVVQTLGQTQDDTRKRRIHMALVRVADEKEIDKRPSFDKKPEREWKAWLKKNKKSFPSKLGKWKGPPPEEDDEEDDD